MAQLPRGASGTRVRGVGTMRLLLFFRPCCCCCWMAWSRVCWCGCHIGAARATCCNASVLCTVVDASIWIDLRCGRVRSGRTDARHSAAAGDTDCMVAMVAALLGHAWGTSWSLLGLLGEQYQVLTMVILKVDN